MWEFICTDLPDYIFGAFLVFWGIMVVMTVIIFLLDMLVGSNNTKAFRLMFKVLLTGSLVLIPTFIYFALTHYTDWNKWICAVTVWIGGSVISLILRLFLAIWFKTHLSKTDNE